MKADLNEEVRELLQSLIDSGQEIGLQVAAYRGEDQIVDTWAGLADEASGRAVDGDTLFTCWSVTKGFTATCIHMLVDRKVLTYETRIASIWREFAGHGKADATVRDALMHAAGVPHLPDGIDAEAITNWDAMCRSIADLEPLWKPGTQIAYHAWTFGWILGEVIRRIDGRSIAEFARQELCRPLGIADFYLGVSGPATQRIATVRHETPSVPAASPTDLQRRVLPPQITCADTINRPDVRAACLPATAGIMSARAIARHYAMLARGGAFGGVRLLSESTILGARGCATDAVDSVLGLRMRRGLGYCLGGTLETFGDERMGVSGEEFGHPGLGGSMGFADPQHGLAFGLAKTLLKGQEDKSRSAAALIARLIRSRL